MQDAKLIQELIYALAEVDLLLVQDTQDDESCRYCGVEWGKHEPEFPEVQEQCSREKITFLLQRANKYIKLVSD